MNKSSISDELEKKAVKAEDIAKNVLENPSLLPEIFSGVSSENARRKFKCAKILRLISEKNPVILYPKMEFFVDLLDSGNNILKWIAIDVVGNLASIDSENKFDQVLEKYYSFLSDETMITIGHVVDSSGRIAQAKPHLTQRITGELLKMEDIIVTPRLTQECKNILLGKTIVALGMYFDQIRNKDDVISFVERQLHNTRNATRVKAEKFLMKFT